MLIKRSLCATAVALTLTACGGGSGSESSTTEPTPPPVTTPPADTTTPDEQGQTFAGATADGYLVNANVCLDVNLNGECDADEPQTLTAAGGVFEFDNISDDIDLTTTPLLVEVIAGQTEDEDEPGVAIAESYTLTAPAGYTDFVSPLTSMLAAELKADGSLTIEEAAEAIEQRLGLDSDSGVSILDDYVAAENGDDEAAKEYKRLHKLARVTAKIVAKTLKKLYASGELGDDFTKEELEQAITKTLANNVEEITKLIDEAEASEQDIDIDTIVAILIDNLPLDQEDIQGKVEQRRDNKENGRAVVADLLAQDGGINLISGIEERFYREDIDKCIVERGVNYQNFYSEETELKSIRYYFNHQQEQFVAKEHEETEDFALVWQGDVWQEPILSYQLGETLEDGSLLLETPYQGIQKISAQIKDVSDKKMRHFVDKTDGWKDMVSRQEAFPEQASAYKLKIKRTDDVHLMPFSNDCEWADGTISGRCNLVYAGGDLPLTQLSELLTSETDNSGVEAKLIFLGGNDFQFVTVSLFGESDSEEGKANFFLNKNKECDGQVCHDVDFLGDGSWKMTERGITLKLPSHTRSWLDRAQVHQTFTVYEGYVRRTFTLKKGIVEHGIWSFNSTAMTSLIEHVDPEKFREELSSTYCGVPKKEDDPEETPPKEDEPEAAPELSPDIENTEKLVNKLYFSKNDYFNALVSFDEQDMLRVWYEDREDEMPSADYKEGDWIIDAEKQLLLTFNEQDWTLLKVIEDSLGASEMWLKEKHEEHWKEYRFIAAEPLTPADMFESLNFQLTSEVDPHCSIAVDLVMTEDNMLQGIGYADMEKCEHRALTDNLINELSWWQADSGEMVIQWSAPENSDGSNEDEHNPADFQQHMYWLYDQEKDRVLFRATKNGDENSDGMEFFETFQYQSNELN